MKSQADGFRSVGLNAEGNGGYSRPKTFTAADLMALELPAVKWVVPGILPEGVTLLAGKPKLGKSWLAFGIAVALASGGVVLGTKRVEQGEALYLALEDNQRRLQKRLGKLLSGDGAPGGLHMSTAWPRVDEGGEEALEGWIADHAGARLVVVDVLKRVRPRASRHRSIYDADYESLESLHALADRHGIAVLCVHHLRKAGADDPMDEISGSTGLSGAADGVLLLRRDRGRGDAYLHVDGRDIEESAELALTWNPNTACWTLAGDAEQYRLSQTRAEIIRVLDEAREAMTPTDVADALGKSVNTVKQRLWHMSREGQVLASDGRYSVPESRNPRNRLLRVTPVTRVTRVTHDPSGSEDGHGANQPCIHGYPAGKGCYLCDPEHPARRDPRRRGFSDLSPGKRVGEKFTPGRKNAIVRKMREGHYAKTAAQTSGITEQTLYNWLKKGEDPERYPEHAAFLEAYRRAEAEADDRAIKAVQDAFPDDWRAAMTYLERRYPGRWAKRQNVDVTSEGQPLRTVEVVRPCPPREGSGPSAFPSHPTS